MGKKKKSLFPKKEGEDARSGTRNVHPALTHKSPNLKYKEMKLPS